MLTQIVWALAYAYIPIKVGPVLPGCGEQVTQAYELDTKHQLLQGTILGEEMTGYLWYSVLDEQLPWSSKEKESGWASVATDRQLPKQHPLLMHFRELCTAGLLPSPMTVGLLCQVEPHSKKLRKYYKILSLVLLSHSELLASLRVDWSAATVLKPPAHSLC